MDNNGLFQQIEASQQCEVGSKPQPTKTVFERLEEIEDKLIECRHTMQALKKLEKANLDPMGKLLNAEEAVKNIVQQIRQEIKRVSKVQQIPEPADKVQWESIIR